MAVSYNDIARFAEDLARTASCEIERRVAASKAYYSAFHAARSFQNRLNKPRGKVGGSHATICLALTSMPPKVTMTTADMKRIRKIGHLLRRCRDRRCEADYDLHLAIEQMYADRQVRDCAFIRSEISDLAVAYPNKRIRAGKP